MSRIVHIVIACFYKEGYGYQENILPVKHHELGNDVIIITNSQHKDTQYEYVNKDGIKVINLENNKCKLRKIPYFGNFINRTKGLSSLLFKIRPDIIFIHGLQAIDNLQILGYKKKFINTKIFVDQHGDYYNMPLKPLKNWIIQKTLYTYVAHKLSSIAEVMWGVTPWRVEYLQKVYNVPSGKTNLLVMGGDEKLIDWEHKDQIKDSIRLKYNIPNDIFLIITGGKIDRTKNIHLLMESIGKLKVEKVKLLIFGNINEEIRSMFVQYIDNKNIIYIGWIKSQEVYPLFLASDLGFFPGTHSVLWEQALASGLPCVFKDWGRGMNHLDVGGNCILIKDVTLNVITDTIHSLIEKPEKYKDMLEVSNSKARVNFSYLEIAKRSLLLDT